MNSGTLLFRQIHPTWTQNERVTSQAFTPTPKDNSKLSVYDGDQITAEGAWKHYRQSQGLDSVGVLAVTVAECEAQNATAQPDPTPFPEHAVIDFSALTNSQEEEGGKASQEARRATRVEIWSSLPLNKILPPPNPTPPTRPSGLPWLGDVPAHWEVRRLKSNVCRFCQYDRPAFRLVKHTVSSGRC